MFPKQEQREGKTIIVLQVPLSSQIHRQKGEIYLPAYSGGADPLFEDTREGFRLTLPLTLLSAKGAGDLQNRPRDPVRTSCRTSR